MVLGLDEWLSTLAVTVSPAAVAAVCTAIKSLQATNSA